MHDITKFDKTPYEKAALLLSFLVKEFDADGQIPCYIFGDVNTKNKCVVPLKIGSKDAYI